MYYQAACHAEGEQFDVAIPGGMAVMEGFRTKGLVSAGAICSAMLRVQDLEQA